MNETYILKADGSVVVIKKDIFDNVSYSRAHHVPREVRDCFKFYRCTEVRYDGFRARPAGHQSPMPEPPVRHVHHYQDRDVTTAAVGVSLLVGAILGGALSGGPKKQKKD